MDRGDDMVMVARERRGQPGRVPAVDHYGGRWRRSGESSAEKKVHSRRWRMPGAHPLHLLA